jgi:16S rRNA (cytidine1402-2'-O)-methyltransferase
MSKLFLIPTPIGNLQDTTFRAIKVLKDVDLILAEDTRVSGKFLKYFEIKTRVQSYHQHNEHQTTKKWLDFINDKKSIAIISDAGTPLISDPGFLLVRECIEQNIDVVTLPGATAFIPALINSGIPCNRFVFEGFLPLKKGRKKRLDQLKEEKRTMVFYESPHRIIRLLEEFIVFFGDKRNICVCREITKIYEQTLRGSVKEILDYFKNTKPRGEFTLIVEGKI